MPITHRITPFLWFDNNAEDAVNFYLSVFKNSRKTDSLITDAAPQTPKGGPITIAFELDGQPFTALNGGPMYKFNKAVSFVVHCENQEEIDFYWSKLSDGGSEIQCGWLEDRFGLAWQIVPTNIAELLRPPNAFKAMLQMKKLDIAELQRAANS